MPITYGDALLRVIQSREKVRSKYDKPVSDMLDEVYALRDERDHLRGQLIDVESKLTRAQGKIVKLYREVKEGNHE